MLYGTPDPDADAPATAKTGARDPLDPVMPARARPARTVPTAFGGGPSPLDPATYSARIEESVRRPTEIERYSGPGYAARKGISLLPREMEPRSPFPNGENTPRSNPPKVIHPEITAPPGIDGKWIWSPLMVTPSQIEMLWRELENPADAFDSFRKGHEQQGTKVPDPTTGELRPPTQQELEIWFMEWQQHIRDFLEDYNEQKDTLFPDEHERVPPLMPIPPENPVG